jgi:hypothetical protein
MGKRLNISSVRDVGSNNFYNVIKEITKNKAVSMLLK